MSRPLAHRSRSAGFALTMLSVLVHVWIDAARAATAVDPSTRPDVLWTSSPTLPNETCLVTYTGVWTPTQARLGRPHDTDEMRAELCRSVPDSDLDQCRPTDLATPRTQADNTTAAFVIPADWPLGTFGLRLCRLPCTTARDCALHCSEWRPINAAQPRWALADRGAILNRDNGHISVFGRSLGFENGKCISAQALAPVRSASIRLIPKSSLPQNSPPIVLNGLRGTCYELRTTELPVIQPGKYTIEVHNGLEGGKWVPVPSSEISVVSIRVPDTARYDVDADYGGNISAALEAARHGSSGDQVVLANNRTYEQSPHVTLQIPDGIVLRARSSDGSHLPPKIEWTSPAPLRRNTSWKTSTPCVFDLDNIGLDLRECPPLVYGRGNFSLLGVHIIAPALTPLLAIGDSSHGALVRACRCSNGCHFYVLMLVVNVELACCSFGGRLQIARLKS
jgi:hypothetical protein